MSDDHPQHPKKPEDILNLTDTQVIIISFLGKADASLHQTYLGILHSLNNKSNPDYLSQAAHSAREFLVKIPSIAPELPNTKRNKDVMTKVGELVIATEKKLSARELGKLVAGVIAEYRKANPMKKRFGHLFQVLDSVGLPAEEEDRIASEVQRLYKWFVGVCHHGDTTHDQFKEQLAHLESFLISLSHRHFDIEPHLEKLAQLESPSNQDLKQLEGLLSKSSLRSQWFTTLENHNWLPLLKEANFFKSPIAPIHSEYGTSCPSWPQAHYLEYCALFNPDLVTEILLVVESTENARVHQQLVEVALQLPATCAGQVSILARNWIKDDYKSITLLPRKLAELIAKLAREKQTDRAFDLASRILDVRIDTQKWKHQRSQLGISIPLEAEAHVDPWHYRDMIKHCDQSLFGACPIRYISLLCDLLNKAISLPLIERKSKNKSYDYLEISRPAIEANERNTSYDELRDTLITHIRDNCDKFIGSNDSLLQLNSILEKYTYNIYVRIKLYLLTEHSEHAIAEIEEVVNDDALYDKSSTRHEFIRLLRKTFGALDESVQDKYLTWIDKGPDLKEYKARVKESTGQTLTDEGLKRYSEIWKIRKLTPIKSHLSQSRFDSYEILVEAHGMMEDDFPLGRATTFVGPTSPQSREDLAQKTPSEVLKYITEWKPSEGFGEPSPDGLARMFAEDVKLRVEQYLPVLVEIDASEIGTSYLYWLFHGLEQALKDGKSLQWTPILSLAKRITTETLPEPQRDRHDPPNWSGVKKEIASLIHAGLENKSTIPFGLRDQVWELIEALCSEENPTLAFEQEYGGDNLSPVDNSINTTRGKAAHALFKFASWVDNHNNLGRVEDQKEHIFTPEALDIVDRFLDPTKEPTQIIRSVVGWYLAYLEFFAPQWTKENLKRIIPDGAEYQHLKHAVFTGYFSFNPPRASLFINLRSFYEEAVEWALQTETNDFHRSQSKCIEHIIAFYWWGDEPIEGNDSLILRVFVDGNVETRSRAIDHIGRSLETIVPVTDGYKNMLRRIQELLEWRIKTISETPPPKDEVVKELREFGWWFTYGQLDQGWLINYLQIVLEFTEGEIEWGHGVLKRLLEFVSDSPEEAAEIIERMVRSKSNRVKLDYWSRELHPLFEAIKKTKCKKSWEIVVETINFLGEIGVREYRVFL